jgi:phosphate transport system substrate-binding protein
VAVVHRSDGSGTTSIFTDYLAKVSPEWKAKVGAGKSVKWPAGLGAKGNEGVTGLVKGTPGAVGYVELAYAHQNKLPMASLRNRDGNFVKASPRPPRRPPRGGSPPTRLDHRRRRQERVSDRRFTYLLVYRDQADKAKGEALVRFLWWAIHDGQASAAPLDYAPLPAAVVKKVEKTLASLTVQGKPVPLASSR